MADARIAKALMDAADLVERGWCQGHFHIYGKERFCVRGALLEVTKSFHHIERLAEAFVRKGLGAPLVDNWLTDWNDAPERTQAEVVAALRNAAAIAEAEPAS